MSEPADILEKIVRQREREGFKTDYLIAGLSFKAWFEHHFLREALPGSPDKMDHFALCVFTARFTISFCQNTYYNLLLSLFPTECERPEATRMAYSILLE